jgi:quinol monooxygenase YgiN
LDQTIRIISRWLLRSGCPPELRQMLDALAAEVIANEPGTLSYRVNLPAPAPLDKQRQPSVPPPTPIPDAEQVEVVFMERYLDAEAFSVHVNGPVFTRFKAQALPFFLPDPNRPGWPKTVTTFLTCLSSASPSEELS